MSIISLVFRGIAERRYKKGEQMERPEPLPSGYPNHRTIIYQTLIHRHGEPAVRRHAGWIHRVLNKIESDAFDSVE